MRRWRATMMMAMAIPISLFVTFIMLNATGRTINIISLAGLAFAVGMVLDSAIVVLENIVRLRESGKSSEDSALEGASQVRAALFASTATTVAIFLPIVFLRDIAGQLFADLALAIAMAVVAALLIAITVIPTAANNRLRNIHLVDPHSDGWDRGTALIMRLTGTRTRRNGIIAGLTLAAVGMTIVLLPETDCLPEGRQNFIFGFVPPPPGVSVPTAQEEFIDVVNERMRAHLDGTREPAVKSYSLGMFGNTGFMGARAAHYVVRALGDGLYVGDYFDGEQRLDMILRDPARRHVGHARGARVAADRDARRRHPPAWRVHQGRPYRDPTRSGASTGAGPLPW